MDERLTKTLHYKTLREDAAPAIGARLGYGPRGPYVVSDVRTTEQGVDIDLVAVVDE